MGIPICYPPWPCRVQWGLGSGLGLQEQKRELIHVHAQGHKGAAPERLRRFAGVSLAVPYRSLVYVYSLPATTTVSWLSLVAFETPGRTVHHRFPPAPWLPPIDPPLAGAVCWCAGGQALTGTLLARWRTAPRPGALAVAAATGRDGPRLKRRTPPSSALWSWAGLCSLPARRSTLERRCRSWT